MKSLHNILMTGLTLTCITLLVARPVSAQLKQGEIAINNIPVRDFISGAPDKNEITIVDTPNELILFYKSTLDFRIEVYGLPYSDARKQAENTFLSDLRITRNESCFLNVQVIAPASVHPGLRAKPRLRFCEGPARVDFNEDGVVNGVDYAEVLEGVLSPTSDMVADLNLNGVVDATDISIALQYFGEDVVVEEEPVQTLVEPEFEE